MPSPTILLCTDGSDLAIGALRLALPLLAPAARTVIVTVRPESDPSLVAGTGMASGVLTADEYDRALAADERAAQSALAATVRALGMTDAETVVASGHDPGRAICELAGSLPASVIVLGTRGHGGLRRAVLGSTSDHVVRHAPCPVLVHAPE
jgi:nucleotide-binding universal stress UspA family protein